MAKFASDTQCETRFGFPKRRRLLARREFLEVYAHANKAFGRYVVVFMLKHDETRDARVGLTATRKTAKACQRNFLRRRGREFFRHHQHLMPRGVDFVINFKQAALKADFNAFERDLEHVFKRLGIIFNQ